MSGVLGKVNAPEDIKRLSAEELKTLAAEIRELIIRVTSEKGGHLAASLGAVELAIALHYCLSSPKDKIIWDVGHQSYAHKILTGRKARFATLREMGGLSGFPNAGESVHDIFTSGHSATSISSALGLACSRDIQGENNKVVAVIGDSSLATGLAFEALNNGGHRKTDILVVLNDNEHSISKPVGAFSRYLNNLITNPLYNRVREETENLIKNIPGMGQTAYKTLKKFQEGLKNLILPGIIFEEMGFRYFGPVDGNDIEQMIAILRKILPFREPVLLHTVTKKGRGYKFAEEDPIKFHGVGAFDPATGKAAEEKGAKSFTAHFGAKMTALADKNKKIAAITAAMPQGTGLESFAEKFPDRFFDVGITESHAVTFAGGLAKGGLRPVVAIYSTFLQRAYDQIIHDVMLQDLPVVFCVDRAGLVGEDGPTHHGIFDIAYFRSMPRVVVMAPKDGLELEMMLEKSLEMKVPVAIRYPRGEAKQVVGASSTMPIEFGRSEKLRRGKDIAIIAVGSMVNKALGAADVLSKNSIESLVVNARFIKPLDTAMLEEVLGSYHTVFTVEEGVVAGGFGSSVLEFASRRPRTGAKVHCIGLPDEFIEHGSREELLRKYHMTSDEMAGNIMREIRGQ
ncbi:MAG: 1-deoxy-D-xylulose-5-phosphate synthase [Candidatus Omnitrophica bacterium]|nr:1-deoxy-D-xylulose-5-phosphate synthase [Candidatus Omnitrophota bacterium]